MEPQKMRKYLKLLTLLISTILIATASAQVYKYMFMSATVGVKATDMSFVEGANFAEAGGELLDNAQKVTFSAMNGEAGRLITYLDPVGINNANATAGHLIELKLDSWTGIVSTPLFNITITMYDGVTQKGASIVLIPGDVGQVETSGDQTIPATTTWRVEWKVHWNGDALLTDSVQVNLLLVIKS